MRMSFKCRMAAIFVAASAFACLSSTIASAQDENSEDEVASEVATLEATPPGEDKLPISFVYSMVVNQAMLIWNDGVNTGSNFVGSSPDGTNITVEGESEFGDGWTTGFVFGLDILYQQSDTVDQLNGAGEGDSIKPSDLFLTLGHENYGLLVFGYAGTASDGVDSENAANADALASPDVSDWNAAFFVRGNDLDLDAEIRWGDYIDGALAGDTRNVIFYETPEYYGFKAAAAYDGVDYWDVGLRFEKTWEEQVAFGAAIGYWKDTTGEIGADEPTEDSGWGASVAMRHLPSGLNIAFNYSTADHANRCAEPGAISDACRGDDYVYYVIGGIERDFTGIGNTSIYGEYYRGDKAWNESDSDTLAAFELFSGEAEELSSSEVTAWGAGVVQYVENTAASFYLGYRHYELEVDLLGADGPVAAKPLKGLDMVMTGVRFKF